MSVQLTVSSITAVAPNPRNVAVSSLDVVFSVPINTSVGSGAITLTDNGKTVSSSGVSLTLVSGSTYEINGLASLTTAEGNYALTINAADIKDTYGDAGSGSDSTTWLMDTTPPSSTVSALASPTTSTTFTVSASASDPVGTNGSPASGVASIAIYDSTNGGPFVQFATVSPSDPSASFTGKAGNTYGFYSIATDEAGNVQPTPTAAGQTIHVLQPMIVSSIAAVSPNSRNTSVSSIDVTFSVPINPHSIAPGAVILTDNSQTISTATVTLTLVSGSTYQINGLSSLTTAQGNYTLVIHAADIKDVYGNTGTGAVASSWLMETTPPTSTVNPLSPETTSSSFVVSVTASDPKGASGTSASGVASIALYDSTNGGPFVLWTTVSPFNPIASFTGQGGNTYAFYSIATDNAGNVQPTPAGAQAATAVIHTSMPTASVIVGEQPLFLRKTNKKGKPTGKAVLSGFTLDFGVPLNSAAAGQFQLDTVTKKKLKKGSTTVLHPITNFTVSYVAASDAVQINFGANQTFPTGGQLTILSGVTTANGGTLTGNEVFTISKGGKSISPSS